ncbi:MAG: hypothetical protein M1817_005678 [Caeruleum heppii]|nr:MAG: hypothetical protein M1817_005678 [Caeruleum heppii]
MAKTANSKRTARSVHSRAAKRATSPSINLDASLKDLKVPSESLDTRPSVLAIHHGAGVTKKTKKARPLSSKARKRQEQGLERAEHVMDKMEKKVAKSVVKGRVGRERRAAWEELNESIVKRKPDSKKSRRTEGVVEDVVEAEENIEVATGITPGPLQKNANARPLEPSVHTDPAEVALPDEDEIL